MNNRRTAVIIDGAFFLKRLSKKYPKINKSDPIEVANIIHLHALRHTRQKMGKRDADNKPIFEQYDLYRVFFYDCPPFEGRMHWPISKKSVNFAKTPEAEFRKELHKQLLRKRKIALRLGHLLHTVDWRIKSSTQAAIIRKELHLNQLTDSHFEIDTKQKGVDMRLGLDVASLSYKRLVDQIVLIVGDSDFVPAAKIARREGIDIVIDPLGKSLPDQLFEHTDGIRSPEVSYEKRIGS